MPTWGHRSSRLSSMNHQFHMQPAYCSSRPCLTQGDEGLWREAGRTWTSSRCLYRRNIYSACEDVQPLIQGCFEPCGQRYGDKKQKSVDGSASIVVTPSHATTRDMGSRDEALQAWPWGWRLHSSSQPRCSSTEIQQSSWRTMGSGFSSRSVEQLQSLSAV
jgi:hypothetical protein